MSDAPTNLPAPDKPGVDVPPLIDARVAWKKPGWLWLALAALFAGVAALLFFFNPGQYSFYPFCVFYRVTGWECPGCGGLRAAHQLLHGHIATAFKFNPLVVTAAPLVLAWLVHRWWRGPGKPVSHRAMARRAWVAFVLLVLFWVARNLPIEFFKQPGG
jgi:hypothetical protein